MKHRHDYRAIVFSPYLFWTTLVGAEVAPERSIVMPCLHDEGYARLNVVRRVVGSVARAWYLSEPEQDLAVRLGIAPATGDLTGAGVEVPESYDPDGFRARRALERPFVLYAGRREEGKGWPVLLDAFTAAVARGADLDLVTMGVGEIDPPASIADRVHDVGFLSDQEAADAFSAAAVYVQPSRNESFSRTVMESWLAGTPVLANGESDVVRWHCERSAAGVVWHGVDELAAALEAVVHAPEALRSIGKRGRDYVLQKLHLVPRARPHGAESRVVDRAAGPMRWVIIGPYLPERGEGALAAAAMVRGCLDAGDVVHVVSPRPSAAHEHWPLVGRRAIWDMAELVRGADGLWLRVEPGIALTRQPSRQEAIFERALLRRVLNRVRTSVIDVGDVGMLPGGRAGRLVLDKVGTLVVRSEADRRTLIANGAEPGRIEVRPAFVGPPEPAAPVAKPPAAAPPAMPAPPPDELLSLPVDAGREAIEAAVRARARVAPVGPAV